MFLQNTARIMYRGFSLIELLAVIGVIALIAAITVPAISGVTQARGVTDAAYQLSAAVEQARVEAVARRTYVWLGIEQTISSGTYDLQIGLVSSKNSSADASPANLQAVGNVMRIREVGLAASGMDGALEMHEFADGASFASGNTTFAGRTLTFTPQGEVATAPSPGPETGFVPLAAIGIRAAQGLTLNENNPATVTVDGSIATASILRTP